MERFDTAALAEWMARQRWFATKSRRIVTTAVHDRLRVGDATLYLIRVGVDGGAVGRRVVDDGDVDRYVVALEHGPGIVDALGSAPFCRAVLALMGSAIELRGERGTLVGRPSRAFPRDLAVDAAVRRISGEQSNTSIVFGDALIMKLFRRLVDGVNPDLEVTRFLTEHTTFRNTPRLAGSLEYVDGGGGSATLAMAEELVRDGRDGWQWTLDRLAVGDGALGTLRHLGRRTAELHVALGTPTADPAFAVEPIGRGDVAAWATGLGQQVATAREAAGSRVLPDLPRGAGDALAGLVGATKSRHHGDFHLGQTLVVGDGDDVMLIDFEGEPLRPLEERRRKHTPLRDVAGMLRSFAYAAATSARAGRDVGDWETRARAAFLEGYRGAAGRATFLPASSEAFVGALAALELEKAAYEIVYEANNRPDWLDIPIRGFVTATAALARAAGAA
jgi:maltose alpha-D-glucosyltransferase/alpha-amylase